MTFPLSHQYDWMTELPQQNSQPMELEEPQQQQNNQRAKSTQTRHHPLCHLQHQPKGDTEEARALRRSGKKHQRKEAAEARVANIQADNMQRA